MPTTHRFSIRTRLTYQLSEPGWLLLNLAVSGTPSQKLLKEEISNNLGLAFRENDGSKMKTRFHGVAAPTGLLEILYEAEVEREIADTSETNACSESRLIDLPHDVVSFLYPSRYCESDKLVRMAAKRFGDLHPGHERVAGICNWIHSNIDYQTGSTNTHTSAVDCLIHQSGVCRDFAHLGVAFCRAMGIPARYCSGYAYQLPTQDFHAFFEVWLGDRWWYYDATRLAPQQGFLWVGSGHDAANTSVATMSASVQFGVLEISVDKLSAAPVAYADGPIFL
jgi:transglutaminase-like putative cysteine protease